MTDYQKLFEELQTIKYPNADKVEMIPIPYKDNGGQFNILKLGFFPAGRGTFLENDENISSKEIMILGQDFDCKDNYDKTDKNKTEGSKKNATWRNLLSFLEDLKEVRIVPENCFFTNAIMGVRKGDKGTGKSPAFNDENFISECREFFLYQLQIQKPKAIFVLGKYVAEFLAPLSKSMSCWQSIENFAEVDYHNKNYMVLGAEFEGGIKTNLVLLVHPSLRKANLRHRRLVDYSGKDVEVEMVRHFLKLINL